MESSAGLALMAIHFHYPSFDFTKSVRANANYLLIMSPTSSKAGKHSVYLREDVFHCNLMLLIREREIAPIKSKHQKQPTLSNFSLIEFSFHSFKGYIVF